MSVLLEPNVLFDEKYRLVKKLGQGGYSEVWLATDEKIRLNVALKIYVAGSGLDEGGLRTFMDEFSLVFNLNHSNLLRPASYGDVKGVPYLVLSYCEQGSAKSLIGRMKEEQVWRFIRDVASGFRYLHSCTPEIIHQDFKPENILISADGTFMIIAFGVNFKVRQTLRRSMPNASFSGGTTAFISPERFGEDKRPIKASDIWALGATIYELMCEDTPFGDYGGLTQKAGAEIPKVYGEYSDKLKMTVRLCLSLNPWDRPTTDQLVELAEKELRRAPDVKSINPLSLKIDVESFKETVNGVSFDMVAIEGGSFMMGSNDGFKTGKPAHRVNVSDFYLGKTEVTQAIWRVVMGNNPSNFRGDNLPVESVSWDDVQVFIEKLNRLTGKKYRLPTEAEWEYAAGGGSKNRTKYTGTDQESLMVNYAWYDTISCKQTHEVATKLPNSLGLYDMGGNVWEWCDDWESDYSANDQVNPTGSSTGSRRVTRGGGWYVFRSTCQVTFRYSCEPGTRFIYLGFRLSLSDQLVELAEKELRGASDLKPYNPLSLEFEVEFFKETVNGVSFEMVAIEGGSFMMGSNDGYLDQKPVHLVTVSDFYIGKTEVTQALWKAVMGNNPSYFKGDNLPVEQVSWVDAQEFIKKLNRLTRMKYRLPTEAEWEYAAGGGAKDRTNCSGTDVESSVANYAWYGSNSGNQTHEVATKSANSLGLYDMSGNVYEWCNDWYYNYSSTDQVNPTGASTGSYRVVRGGSWNDDLPDCRVANRYAYGCYDRVSKVGFRLSVVP